MKKFVDNLLYFQCGLLFIFATGFFSCNTNDKDKRKSQNSHKTQTKPIGSLTGQFYQLGPELDSVECKATGGCDCCASHLLFLTDSNFMAVDYCMDNDVYYKGTYKINKTTILFHSDSLLVDKENNWGKWEAKTIDKDLPDFILKTRRDNTSDFKWTSFYFKNRLCFTTSLGDYSTPDNESKKDFIRSTKKDSIWFKLELE